MARLARLSLNDSQVEAFRARVGAVLEYARKLADLDDHVSDLESSSAPAADSPRPALDVPGEMLPRDVLMAMAPRVEPPFLRVPKVHGDGGA